MILAPSAATTGLSDRFACIVDGLCRVIAVRSARDRAAGPMLVLLWSRLRRLAARFAAVAARAQAGAWPIAPAARRPTRARPPSLDPPFRLPRGRAWLVRLIPETSVFGGQLRHLLAEPELAALLATAPHAASLLRPFCRMLAVEPLPERPPPPPETQAKPIAGGAPPAVPTGSPAATSVRASIDEVRDGKILVPA